MGIAIQGQKDKILSDSRTADALETFPVPTIKGLRDADCINKAAASIWILSIDAPRCAITAKGSLQRFQAELFAASDRFLFGDEAQSVKESITGILKLGECPNCGHRLILDDRFSHASEGRDRRLYTPIHRLIATAEFYTVEVDRVILGFPKRSDQWMTLSDQ